MAILYGTTGDGTTLPVLVDQFGNLLAKGIDGQPGQPGQDGAPGLPGPPGADGGDFPLPPNPYEGAFLGWLNNELAWIGTPPVPIPDGVFGPITSWSASGMLVVDGEIPPQVAQGVYVYQCNQDGTIYVDGWNNSQVWSTGLTGTLDNPASNAFNGSTSVTCQGAVDSTMTLDLWSQTASALEIFCNPSAASNHSITFTGSNITTTTLSSTQLSSYSSLSIVDPSNRIGSITMTPSAGTRPFIAALKSDGLLLVDSGEYPSAPNLNFRVQSVNGQSLIGSANRTDDFTIGKYLRVPEQNVARWLYDGNLNKVITSTGIDFSRLTGN